MQLPPEHIPQFPQDPDLFVSVQVEVPLQLRVTQVLLVQVIEVPPQVPLPLQRSL